ncbi:MAG: hypothetical protein AAF490_02635 [Chloroflexota bacterium]
METSTLFNLETFRYPGIFPAENPWESIKALPGFLTSNTKVENLSIQIHPTAVIEGDVLIGAGTIVDALAIIRGPTIIGKNCYIGRATVRQVLTGDSCVIGDRCEVARTILLDKAIVSHQCTILDTVIGNQVNIGGGTIIANVRFDNQPVLYTFNDKIINSNSNKLGALVGDRAKTGAKAVLMPGSIIGKNSIIGATAFISGTVSEGQFVKTTTTIKTVKLNS